MWTWLASLIGGPAVSGLINAYKPKLEAANTKDRIAADLAAKEIEAEIQARKQASSIIITEQGRWYTAIIRPMLAAPVIIYFWKVIVWDKVLGRGSTDPITGMIADWTGLIITAYVGGRSIEKVAAAGGCGGDTRALIWCCLAHPLSHIIIQHTGFTGVCMLRRADNLDNQSLRGFLKMVESGYPDEIVRVREPIERRFDMTGLFVSAQKWRER